MAAVLIANATEELQMLVGELEQAQLRVETCALVDARERGAAGVDALVVNAMGLDLTDASLHALLRPGALPDRTSVVLIVEPAAVPSLPADLPVDDFVAYPATGTELAARIRRAAWRRTGGESSQTVHCGDVTIDQGSYRVFVRNRPVELTYKEYELLRFLVLNHDKVCTREMLLNRVWGYDFYGGARTVDVHIRRLRSKIEEGPQTLIETVRNVGYRFRAEPEA